MQLSKRLYTLSQMITSGSRLADIGTDHGYVPIYLCETGHIPSALAMDINKGPLLRAEEHISGHQLSDRIVTRLSDGMAELKYGEADSVLIAGMGGMLTIHILTEGADVLRSIRELVLQPQSDIREVRLYLRQQGHQVLAEDMVEEEGKYYPMMKVLPYALRGTEEALTEEELRYGPFLLRAGHPVLAEYLDQEYRQLTGVQERLSQNTSSEAAQRRLQTVEEDIRINRQARTKIG